MTQIAILSDTHIGLKNGSPIYSEHFKCFYDDVFFPYLEKHNIKHILHCGDLFDNRKNVNIAAITDANDYLFERLKAYECKIILGNHDTVYRDTLEVNSPALFVNDDVLVNTCESWQGIDLIPWINNENEATVMDFIRRSKNSVCAGHFDLSGFYMYRGIKSHYTSRPTEIFNRYNKVFSGHFHTRSDDDHIYYVGAPYEMTWADYDDPRGFVVYNTDDDSHTYVDNPHTLYQQVIYDNGLSVDVEEGKIVKMIVKKRADYDLFEQTVKQVNDVSIDLKMIELEPETSMSEEELNDFEVIDTLKYLQGWVDRFESELYSVDDKRSMNTILSEIYTEALAL